MRDILSSVPPKVCGTTVRMQDAGFMQNWCAKGMGWALFVQAQHLHERSELKHRTQTHHVLALTGGPTCYLAGHAWNTSC